MDSISKLVFSKLIVVLIVASLCDADDGYIYSRATYYGSPDCLGTPRGACGFEEYGRTVNNGLVAGASRLFKNGSGCGACYQVRCKIPAQCSEEGTTVVVTDFGIGHNTDFIMSIRAYASLASPNMAPALIAYGVVDIEYRRIPCRYNYKLMIKVHEHSYYPSYLAIIAIYQGGTYDIIAAQVWQEDCKQWRWMRRPYGAVWDIENPPQGALLIRFQVSNEFTGEVKWIQIAGAVPSDWKAGVAYETGLQLE
ncbi:hypothetical protein CDL12_18171 [Handroanthus impetiginosus]|uniref:Expansin-like EG45 domain-containing protein n=1 Tax=Handroanthus impetiginosus TaxID=429701 RepID=A0A2G9GVE7_9LAMI|nr:hypothetical protein CDL12_18171 [Handroanthus impetiginosus]